MSARDSRVVDTKFLIESFVTLVVIIDPIGNVPTFLVVTQGKGTKARQRLALDAVLVATVVLAVFAGFGREILEYLGLSLPALQVSGGLLLLIVALQLLTGKQAELATQSKVNVALVPLATPLIAGPGAIATVLVFAGEVHTAANAIGLGVVILVVMLVLLLVLRSSVHLTRLLGDGGIELLSRIFGLLLAAIAVQLAASGVLAFAHGH
jgi:multiple antibiotic resistance protein